MKRDDMIYTLQEAWGLILFVLFMLGLVATGSAAMTAYALLLLGR